MVGSSLHRSCSSAYRRVTGKGGSSKGKAKKRRARQEEEEELAQAEPAQAESAPAESAPAEPAREEPAQEEEPPHDADYEPEAEEASGGSTRWTTLVVTLLVASTSEVARDSWRGQYRLLNGR
jgi:hypothetical protein